MKEAIVVGAGPAGAGAVAGFSGHVDRVVVYEANERLAAKPCGRGIPVIGDLPVRVPRESVYHRIRRAVMYVNGRYLFTLEGVFEGYIVDKERFLEAVISDYGGELVKGAKVKPDGRVRVGGEDKAVRGPGVFAGGHVYYEGEKILAVQYRLKTSEFDDSDTLEIYFDTSLIGYYYVFPAAPGTVDVGVGGFADYNRLKNLLDTFIKTDERLRDRQKIKLEGARIAVGGIVHGFYASLPKTGEAAGFVLPLTGEGIRPSMLSGFYAARAIVDGSSPQEAMDRLEIARAVRVQRRILEAVKRMTSLEREELMRGLPAEAHALISLGRLDAQRLARVLAFRPKIAAKILKYVVQG
ncbi:MAG: NAD(P)/FAD-dependent oxidoreductase [Desulfurococcales archaeon]|nr:NAD(P)/FAD-dependent oxidoreductase [Desulfurococcales archaeon]